MARLPRVEAEDFYDDLDRTKYLEVLAHLKQSHSFRIHAYVLTLNHVLCDEKLFWFADCFFRCTGAPISANNLSTCAPARGERRERFP
jgi:hypothetical protein